MKSAALAKPKKIYNSDGMEMIRHRGKTINIKRSLVFESNPGALFQLVADFANKIAGMSALEPNNLPPLCDLAADCEASRQFIADMMNESGWERVSSTPLKGSEIFFTDVKFVFVSGSILVSTQIIRVEGGVENHYSYDLRLPIYAGGTLYMGYLGKVRGMGASEEAASKIVSDNFRF
jgi:hypothetical protein